MENFEVVLDLDSVLIDTPKSVIYQYNLKYTGALDVATWVTYNPIRNFGEDIGKQIFELFSTPEIYSKDYIYEDVPMVLNELKKITDNISVWTLCLEDAVTHTKKEFVQRHFGIPCDTVSGNDIKGKRQIKGVIIDDYPPNLRSVSSDLKIMPIRPWNKDVQDDDIIKVKNMTEALCVIREYIANQQTIAN